MSEPLTHLSVLEALPLFIPANGGGLIECDYGCPGEQRRQKRAVAS